MATHCVLDALVLSNSRSNSNHHFFVNWGFRRWTRKPLCLCSCQESSTRDTCCAPCQINPSQKHMMTRVSSCFGLSTHPSVSQTIHFPPSECAIYLDGLCLKGFAYATDTLSKALRLTLSPACLWQTWWHEWQSWERKQRGKVREKTDIFNQFTTLRKRRTCIQTIHIWTL